MSGSFERINYSIRPNKSAERKIIMESFRDFSGAFNLPDYKYIGFGSLWFVDFVLLHRFVGIIDMHSIEGELTRERRVNFNKPLGCINVHMGHSSDVIPKILDADKRTLLWLDYDGVLEDALSGGDVEYVIGSAPSGSILLVTVNADSYQIKNKKFNDGEISEADYLVNFCEDYLPADYAEKLSRNKFPVLVGQVLLNLMRGTALDSRTDVRFYPVWNICYTDGVKMVTAGGILLNDRDFETFQGLHISEKNPFVSLDEKQKNLDLPILTLKEKMHLDSKLPSTNGLRINDLEFELTQKDIDTYGALYKFFPLYGEMAL